MLPLSLYSLPSTAWTTLRTIVLPPFPVRRRQSGKKATRVLQSRLGLQGDPRV